MTTATTINKEEVEKFSKLAHEWWDLKGNFKPLHQINPSRIKYIRDCAIKNFELLYDKVNILENFTLLDIGCGGGLIAEPMTRLGAKVTAIDPSEKNIKTAKLHAEQMGLVINYVATSAENLAESNMQFDIVLALEVIEHVDNVAEFIKICSKLIKPGGMLILATLNRTIKSYLLAIVGAEYVLRWLEPGTHDWTKFLTPAEISHYLRTNTLELQDMTGLSLNPLSGTWGLSQDIKVNYMVYATKR